MTLKEKILNIFADEEFVWGFVRKHKVAGSQPVRFKKVNSEIADVVVGVRLKDLATKV